MARIFKILIFSILLHLTHLLHAQFTVFEQNKSHSTQISFTSQALGNDIVKNFIVAEIARSIPKNTEITSIVLDFKSMIQMKKLDSLNYTLFCELKDMKFSGDVFYRKINISHILVPDYVDFQVVVSDKKSSERVVFSKKMQNVPFLDNMGYFQIFNDAFKDTISNADYIASIENISLVWSDGAKERFLMGVALIHDYYLTDTKIDEMSAIVASIDVNHIERVAFNSIVLRDVERDYNVLVQRNFPNELNLWLADPLNYVKRMEDLSRLISGVRQNINIKLERLDRLYYEKGIEKLKAEKFDSARHFHNKAVEYNPLFVPSLTELAYLDYKKGVFDSAAVRIIYVFERAIVSPEDRTRFNEVLRLVVSAIEETVERRILSQDFVEAEELLSLAIQICASAQGVDCSKTMDKLMAKVKYGLYKSLIVVIEKAIENKRFEIASLYIENAKAYQRNNASYIISSVEADKYYEILFQACLKDIEQINQRGQFVRALERLEWLESFCNAQSNLKCELIQTQKTLTLRGLYNDRLRKIETDISDKNFVAAETRMKLLNDFVITYDEIDFDVRYRKAENEIQTFFYQKEISEGISNLEYGFFEPAWNKFVAAYDIQDKYGLDKYGKIDSLSRIAAVTVLPKKYNQIISSGQDYSVSFLRNQQLIYSEFIQRIQLTVSDSLFSLQLKLNEMIHNRICDSLNNEVLLMIFKSDSLASMQKFKVADAMLQLAIVVCQENLSCRLPIEDVLELKMKVKTGVEWESERERLQALVENNNWSEAIELFYYLDKLSESQVLFMWGVKRQKLREFIAEQKKKDFLFAGFEYFFDKKLYDDAFEMLEQLRKIGCAAIETVDQQIRLGQKLAVRDKINNPDANFKINILKYTEGEDFFSYFSKSYRKKWRKN